MHKAKHGSRCPGTLVTLASPHYIDGDLYSIIKFDFFIIQPVGGYIELLLEADMLWYSDNDTKRARP
jgi:hypothetical protein